MRTPRCDGSSLSTGARCALPLVVLFLAMLASSTARGATVVVAADGSGEFTSVQEGADSLAARTQLPEPDSLIVMPGAYDESLVLPPAYGVLLAPGGPSATSLTAIHVAAEWSIAGFRVLTTVIVPDGTRNLVWRDMIFEGGFDSYDDCDVKNMTDCEFHARTSIRGFSSLGPPFARLKFVGAPLFAEASACGPIEFVDCEFIGPADTLVTASMPGGNNEVYFTRCHFSSATHGVVYIGRKFNDPLVRACQFDNLSGIAVWLERHTGDFGVTEGDRLHIYDSCFSLCRTAVRCITEGDRTNVEMVRDTVEDGSGDGIVLSVDGAFPFPYSGLHHVIVRRQGGNGLVLARGTPFAPAIDSCLFEQNAVAGVLVVDTVSGESNRSYFPLMLSHSRATDNGGAGFDVRTASVSIADCIADGNAGPGIRLDRSPANLAADPAVDSLRANTVIRNGGDGIALVRDELAAPPRQLVDHNLVALNAGAGIRTRYPYGGSVACNDAWLNYQGQYVGLFNADSNLVADPKFCDLAGGDLRLEEGSPAAPTGVCGLIGALPVGCASTVDAPPPLAVATFTMAPNPARGEVAFALPPGSGAGTVEILDAQGRRIWSTTLLTNRSTMWRGDMPDGRQAPPGLYLTRCARGNEVQTRRLVWLR